MGFDNFLELYNHCNNILEHFNHPKKSLVPILNLSTHLLLQVTMNYFLFPKIYLFWIVYIFSVLLFIAVSLTPHIVKVYPYHATVPFYCCMIFH